LVFYVSLTDPPTAERRERHKGGEDESFHEVP
jgi:hypothetical protein